VLQGVWAAGMVTWFISLVASRTVTWHLDGHIQIDLHAFRPVRVNSEVISNLGGRITVELRQEKKDEDNSRHDGDCSHIKPRRVSHRNIFESKYTGKWAV
jgi:hypothetical protein